jgi:hypothetical protein
MRRQLLITGIVVAVGLAYALVMQWLLHSSISYEYMLLMASCVLPAIVMVATTAEGLQLGVTRRTLWRVSLLSASLQGLLFAVLNTITVLVLRALHIQAYGMVLFIFNNQVWTTSLGSLLIGSLCGLIGITVWFLIQSNLRWGITAVLILIVLLPIMITVPGLILAHEFQHVNLAYVLGLMAIMLILNVLIAWLNHHLFQGYEPSVPEGKRA